MEIKLTDPGMHDKFITVDPDDDILAVLAQYPNYTTARCSNGDVYFRFIGGDGFAKGTALEQIRKACEARGQEMPSGFRTSYIMSFVDDGYSVEEVVDQLLDEEAAADGRCCDI